MSKRYDEHVSVLQDDYRKLAAAIDDTANGYRGLPDTPPISCDTCTQSDCCNQVVASTLGEALVIAKRLRDEGRDTKALRARLRDQAVGQKSMSRDEWFQTRTPCVFLEKGRCSIYDNRPAGCRAWLVVTPSEWCSADYTKQEKVGALSLQDTAAGATLQIAQGLAKSLGLKNPAPSGDLPEIVLLALRSFDKRDPVKFLNEKLPSREEALKQIEPRVREYKESRKL